MLDPHLNPIIQRLEKDKATIVIKHVGGKTQARLHIQPARDSSDRWLGNFVRQVDAQGNMILSDEDKKNIGKHYFLKVTDKIEVVDGKEFDLTRAKDWAEWDTIKWCNDIAASRAEADSGIANWYVHVPQLEAETAVSKLSTKATAFKFVTEDNPRNHYRIVKLLGNSMDEMSQVEVTEFLMRAADRAPEKIINAYRDPDMITKLLVLNALEKNIINNSNGVYTYDTLILGATLEQAVAYLQESRNKDLKKGIEYQVYPELRNEEALSTKKTLK